MCRKTITITLLVLLSVSIEAQAQVFWKHTTSDSWLNPNTQKIDSFVCFTAVSCAGNNCTSSAIFFNSPIGNVGGINFYRSVDGGKSWFEQHHALSIKPRITNWGVTKIQQIDSLNVVAIADKGVILKSHDGGITWLRIDCPAQRDIFDIHFSDPSTGILVCAGVDSNLFTTTDSGNHWEYRPFPGWSRSCHSYGNGKFRFLQYGRGPLYTTVNNFQSIDSIAMTFDTLSSPMHRYVFSRCAFGKDDIVLAYGSLWPGAAGDTVDIWGSYAAIMRSLDGGLSWEKPAIFPTPILARFSHISSVDRDTIFAGGGDRPNFVMSTDRGKTWEAESLQKDTSYLSEKCFGMSMSGDGRPVAIFGSSGLPVNSILMRGEYANSSVEVIARIRYFTYFFPNPTQGIVNIESIDKSKPIVTVLDLFGRQIARGKLSEDGKLSIDLSGHPPGIYNIVFDHLGKVFIAGKVIVVK